MKTQKVSDEKEEMDKNDRKKRKRKETDSNFKEDEPPKKKVKIFEIDGSDSKEENQKQKLTPKIRIPNIKCEYSKVKSSAFCVEKKLPLHPNIYEEKFRNTLNYKKYKVNLDFFNKRRDKICKKFPEMWFAIWDINEEDGSCKYNVGTSPIGSASGCPINAVVSFGCVCDVIFVKERKSWYGIYHNL